MPPDTLKLLLIGFLVAVYATGSCGGESSTCLTVYKKGGAPAVFQSPKCPLWKLPNYDIRSQSLCQSAMLQGPRKFQEDRTFCALDILIPFPGKTGLREVMVGIVAVFDGHNGAEASEMASKLLLEYFALHTYFLLDATYSLVLKESTGRLPSKEGKDDVFQVLNWDEELGRHELNFDRPNSFVAEKFDDSFHFRVLKEALIRAIHDIDATFSMEASRQNIDSGSTATIVLIADGHILVANVGDSKALLCSEKFQSPAEARATLLRLYRERRRNGAVLPVRYRDNIKLITSNGLAHFIVEELTRDHHPDRDDEKFRVETAGGYVHEWGGVARVNGQLAVSRAIGDVYYKRYGVISAPEVTDWQPFSKNDTYLVVASDGLFEKLNLQDVCDLLWEAHRHGTERSELSSSCSRSLAECLVNTAIERGSKDNVATVVVPLSSLGVPQRLVRERCIGEGDVHCSSIGLTKPTHGLLDNDIITSELIQWTHGHPLISKFDRLLVEGKHGNFGCYYLSENLNDASTMQDRTNSTESYLYDLPQALPEAFSHHYDGPLNLYNDLSLCWNFGTIGGGAKDQCPNPDGFATFLGLLESIPFPGDGSNYWSNDYATPNLRYVLKKRFGQGSYGEVWLGFYWNCHRDSNAANWTRKDENNCSNQNRRKSDHSTAHDCHAGSNDDLFVLKRIMVERGAAVYLSGLREKYFGEVFLNASRCLGGLLVDPITRSPVEEWQSDFEEIIEINKSVHGLGNGWNFANMLPHRFSTQRSAFEEGLSLSKLMYSVDSAQEKIDNVKHIQVLHPSKWWHWLKTTEAGNEEMRNLIWQLLIALKSCHDRNITHRDIKPENMVICFEDLDSGRCLKGAPGVHKNYTTKVRIIDFGSGMDEFTLKHLYGSAGPSRAEQTYEYAPPEALLNASWYQGPPGSNMKYDMWSVGVVILELVLGSPNVFQVGSLTRALLDPHIEGWNEDLKELAYKLRSFMELCILITGNSSKHRRTMGEGGASPASWRCSEEFFSQQIKSRDPLKLGFPNVWALRLVRQLLLWNPEDRLSVDDALQHPYFQHPPMR
ncbi:Protein phosphatase 2C family protein [Euphorbia peplus]|nr:Protein phosphatase 2C family protein [Euphorbia peplus]